MKTNGHLWSIQYVIDCEKVISMVELLVKFRLQAGKTNKRDDNFMRNNIGQNFILQQDNAPIHTAKLIKDYFRRENINVLYKMHGQV